LPTSSTRDLFLDLLSYVAEELRPKLGPPFDLRNRRGEQGGPFVGGGELVHEGRGGQGRLGPLKGEALREYKERSRNRKRRELLRRLWRLSDLIGEEKVEELLKNFEESLKRGSGAKI
jgi:hypothetical protein